MKVIAVCMYGTQCVCIALIYHLSLNFLSKWNLKLLMNVSIGGLKYSYYMRYFIPYIIFSYLVLLSLCIFDQPSYSSSLLAT